MNALTQPPFPTNPSVGERYGNWVWNGVRWVCSTSQGVMVNTVVFTASGPYQPSPGLVSATVECIGGGGAGGSAQVTFSGTGNWFVATGGGGGAGGYSRATLAAALLAGGVSVTIGAGGAPSATPTAPGGAGGQTTFGAYCIANGGSGGQSNQIGGASLPPVQGGGWGFGGGGGAPGTGSIAAQGTAGSTGWTETRAAADVVAFLSPSGKGASSWLGGSPGTVASWGGGASNGVAAPVNSGSGGSGAIAGQAALGQATPIQTGGAGGSGLCIITEYCFQDGSTDGEDCLTPTVNVNAKVAVTKVPWTPGGQPCPPQTPCPTCGSAGGYYVEHFEDD